VRESLRGKSWEERDFPLGMMALSLLGMPRNYMGLENLSYAVYDQPALVEEMIEWQTYYSMEVIKKVLASGVTLDWAIFWEDICYNRGPIVSPDFVRKHMAPRYRKVVDLLRSGGVEVVCLDCDGLIDELLPIWVEAGVNAIFPFECAAGMDALKVRKRFGKDLVIVGNVDKRALAAGKNEIDEQVEKVKMLVRDGGYFVNCDHHIPDNVSYENVVYWVNEIHKLSEDVSLRRVITLPEGRT
jgi:uroporphyrinogen decarboxylase